MPVARELEPEKIEHIAEVIADQEGPVEPEEIAEQANMSERKLTAAIHRLEDVGALEVLPSGEVRINATIVRRATLISGSIRPLAPAAKSHNRPEPRAWQGETH